MGTPTTQKQTNKNNIPHEWTTDEFAEKIIP
jgi:hypothetical protein